MRPALQHSIRTKKATSSHNVRTITWISLLMGATFLAGATGCSAEVGTQDGDVRVQVRTGTTDPKIFGGQEDDDTHSIPGVVALRVGMGGTFELCSGALVAPNLVLTARHCVTKNITTSVSCDENGNSQNGPHVSGNEDPAAIGIYTGANPSFAHAPDAVAKAVVAPSGPYLCDSDIALVVLDSSITDITPLPLRLETGALAGETVRSVGYGQNDSSAPIGTRFRKSVSVLAQGQAVTASRTPLGAHEFEVGKSICQGDSGGPAISEQTGAVIGVVSRGGNCDEDFGHIYTTTAGFKALFDDAFTLADATPTAESGSPTVAPQSATSTSSADDANGQSSAGCSVGPKNAPVGGGAMALAMCALGAFALRRRRAV